MNAEIQSREPRSQVIFRYTNDVLRHTALCRRKLAARIADAYMERIAPGERIVEFHTGTTTDQLIAAEQANAQLVARFMQGLVKLPADLEEAWVSSLPEPYREECLRELVRRHGFLAAKPPSEGKGAGLAGIADLAREFAQTLEALAPIFADGLIDANDRPHLKKALKETTDMMAALVSLQAQLTAALPDQDTAVLPWGKTIGAKHA